MKFIYVGELIDVKLKCIENVLKVVVDRLPTAEIIGEKNGVYTICTESYGNGIYMWLKSQGDYVHLLE